MLRYLVYKVPGFLFVILLFHPMFLTAQSMSDFQRDSALGVYYYIKADTIYRNVDSCLYYSKLAIELLEKTEQWEKYISTLCGLSYCYNTKEQYDLMEANNTFAYEEAKKYLSPQDGVYASALNNYALVQSEIKENYLKALELYKEAYHNLINGNQPVKQSRAGGLQENIGQMYYFLGDFETAIEYYKQAETSFRNVKIDDKIVVPFIRVAKVYDKIAKVYYHTSRFDEARKYQLLSIETLKKAGKTDKNYEIRLKTELAKINITLGALDDAMLLLDALQITNDLTPLQKTKIFHQKGKIHFQKGNFQQAIQNLKLGLQQEITEEKVNEKSEIYRTLSQVYIAQKELYPALQSQQEAVRLLTTDAIENDLDLPSEKSIVHSKLALFKTLKEKGNTLISLYHSKGEEAYLDAALNTYTYLSSLTDDIRSFYRSAESKLFLLENAKDFYEAAINTAYDFYKENKNTDFLEKAFFFAEKSKSNLLLDELRKKEVFGEEFIDNALLKKEYELKIAINSHEKKVYQEKQKDIEKDAEKIRILEDEIFDYKNALANLEDSIKNQYPTYANIVKQQPVSIKAIQEKLFDNQIILEYFVGEKNIYLFKVSQKEVDLIRIKSDFNLDTLLVHLFENINMTGADGMNNYISTAHQLYDNLIRPAVLSTDVNKVIIIPDGQLENLPFDILVTDLAEANSPKNLPYLINDYTISYAYSSTILSHQIEQRPDDDNSILSVFPIFENTDRELLFSKEVHSILSQFSGHILRGKRATVNNFLEKVRSNKIIHFSTHARGVDDQVNEPSIDLFDQTLYLSDLQNQNLDVHLAVLSACETNVGAYRKGEGIMSLSRGFTFAGVPSVITSVSNVYEQSTSSIMQLLYKNLQEGMSKDEALRQAKIQYITSSDNPDSKCTPYYWGTFLAIGNMDSVTFAYKSEVKWYYVGFGVLVLLVLMVMIRFKMNDQD